ncbi:MAG: hypothetical protein V3W14_10665 [Candidatus Neomarinimicrobiota bacterium]
MLAACSAQNNKTTTGFQGAYLGQQPPGLEPQLFAPGVVSTAANEAGSVFTPDGRQLYFARFKPGRGYELMHMELLPEGWTAPGKALFASSYSEVDPFITPDGRRLYYLSKRPLSDGGPRSSNYQIWVVERQGREWINPRPLMPPVNGPTRQLYPTLTSGGVLYFNSTRDGFGRGDLFRASPSGDGFGEIENLGPAVNSEYDETDVLVAPDQSYIIYTAVDKPGGLGGGDLYISFRGADNAWTAARHMGSAINSSASDFCPALSPDGKYLFFTSGRRGSDDVYWVDRAVIDQFRPGS